MSWTSPRAVLQEGLHPKRPRPLHMCMDPLDPCIRVQHPQQTHNEPLRAQQINTCLYMCLHVYIYIYTQVTHPRMHQHLCLCVYIYTRTHVPYVVHAIAIYLQAPPPPVLAQEFENLESIMYRSPFRMYGASPFSHVENSRTQKQ